MVIPIGVLREQSMAAGPSDISVILSQAGRIEKITQNTFVQSEVAKQILTEQEAKERLQRTREVNQPPKAHEITISEKAKQESMRHAKDSGARSAPDETPGTETAQEEAGPENKHIIDVVV